jgi:hypothetical protein
MYRFPQLPPRIKVKPSQQRHLGEKTKERKNKSLYHNIFKSQIHSSSGENVRCNGIALKYKECSSKKTCKTHNRQLYSRHSLPCQNRVKIKQTLFTDVYFIAIFL